MLNCRPFLKHALQCNSTAVQAVPIGLLTQSVSVRLMHVALVVQPHESCMPCLMCRRLVQSPPITQTVSRCCKA